MHVVESLIEVLRNLLERLFQTFDLSFHYTNVALLLILLHLPFELLSDHFSDQLDVVDIEILYLTLRKFRDLTTVYQKCYDVARLS